ncbi:ABC transporter ATP-binding protein [Anaeromyxobacter sp. SG64]|uniref:ABC transporter ATP-binding protein n=1 Tax=Anaeromyxobacter sp. SG64 TaxID=2925409 RepID=UPI001F5A4BCE|nr:ABC transporter transmembrane domain-containing protein [Anaeromyxobacter sp. SG64]
MPARPPTSVLRRLGGLLREELPALSLGTVLLVAGAALALVYPQGIRLIVDGAIAGKDPRAVTRAAGVLAVIAVVQGLAIAGRHLLFSLAGERGVRRVRERLYRSLLDQEIGFFDASRTGELISRLGTDSATIQSLVAANVSMVFRHAITALGGIGLLFVTSPRLTVVMLLVVPPIAVGSVFYGRKVRALARRYQDALADASHVAEESLSAMRTVRAFNAEPAERGRYDAAIAASYDAARRRARAGSLFMGGASAGVYLAIAAVLGYGGQLVARGDLTPGALTAFLVYTLLIAMSLGGLADLWAEAMKGIGAAERVFALMDRVPEMPVAGGLRPSRCDGRIALEGVRFSYPSRPDVEVLGGIDLLIAPGEVVALVGPSGSGKSTVAALLGRLYDPLGGRLTLDGHDLRSLDPTWLRAQIGVVPQEPTLFSASVEENVRYGRPDATHEEVVAACRAAHADAFVRGFPEGYATRVGERGQQLSGGQRQRLAIARAVLKDPRILLLDEATSALDAESEALVKDALARLMTGRTTVIIAHRLSTVASADRVVVIEGGLIVESGPHRELVARGGLYQRLVERQLRAG